MGLGSKIFGGKKTGTTEGYVDLEKYVDTTKDTGTIAKMHVGIGEIQRYEDIKKLSDYVYGGNVLILDFSPISDEEVILKRITDELRKIADDIGGDIAGIGNNLMIISPCGVKIDRRKIRGTYA
ncbi:MAG: cell division protein SepF [Thermoplasmatales archaeon]|nr:MAG: cell division protein SepF [Thermoplasmatales archaeon]